MPGAARLNDTGKGHECFPDTPVIAGSPDIIINGQPAARVGDALAPHGCPCSGSPHGLHGRAIAAGSSNVIFNGKAAARIGDAIDCGGKIITGSGDVIIGNTPWQSPAHDCGKQTVLRGAPLLALTPALAPEELNDTVALLSR
jgi:uncharacterized Zn-binding protein involved in type VI secretion